MHRITPLLLAAATIVFAACTTESGSTADLAADSAGARSGSAATATDAAGFVNRVWSVSASTSVAPGTLYTFLSDGTLVIASANGTPMLGTWKREGAGLTMVEESIAYPVEILALESNLFRIRSNNPGGAVEITLVPAETSK